MRYQFQSNPGQLSYKPALFTDAIKILVSVNFGIFLLQTIARTESLFFPLFGKKSFLNQTLGLRKSFLNQTTYVLKNRL